MRDDVKTANLLISFVFGRSIAPWRETEDFRVIFLPLDAQSKHSSHHHNEQASMLVEVCKIQGQALASFGSG